ncbi:hemin uptake protein HemP [Sulfuricaulis sp.]
MSSRRHKDAPTKRGGAGNAPPDHGMSGSVARPADGGPVPRVHSHELLRHGEQLVIEHAGREYRLRVTSNGKLILTA